MPRGIDLAGTSGRGMPVVRTSRQSGGRDRVVIPVRLLRSALFVTLAAAGVWALYAIQNEWRSFADGIGGLPHLTSYFSVWTFVWPSTLAVLMAIFGATTFLRNRDDHSRGRLVYELVYFALSLYLFYAIGVRMWWAYNPHHSGPAL
ncbi:MAG TPA: hypothetical protein VGF28_05060 [Thermoanaerobaculia bacterium]